MRPVMFGALLFAACGFDLADAERETPAGSGGSVSQDASAEGGQWPEGGGADAGADAAEVESGTDGATDAAADAPVYSWKADASWSACSVSCGGGVMTRNVWCESSTGAKVADAFCSGTKPSTSQSCNTQPCCTTGDLVLGKKCGGTAKVQWYPFSPNDSSSAALTKCRDMCTSWATSNGYQQWCCQYYDDSSPGANWVCRVYDAYSTSPSSTNQNHASLGKCG